MKIEINFTNTTDFVAWWGAVVATAVFIWDIYKWKTSGAKISLKTSSNMKAFNIPNKEKDTWIVVTVENNGDRPTTITIVALKRYKNLFFRLFPFGFPLFLMGQNFDMFLPAATQIHSVV